jgi:hypothetical protein
MVVIKRRKLFKSREPEKTHDFSGDEGRCAKCGMTRRVWDYTRVTLPTEAL